MAQVYDTDRTTATTDRSAGGAVKIPSGINVVAGIWLIIAPFVLTYTFITAALWNDILVGIAVVILAGIRVARPNLNPGLSWTNVVLGVWLIAAPFILTYTGTIALWNDIIVGIIIAALGVWSALATPS